MTLIQNFLSTLDGIKDGLQTISILLGVIALMMAFKLLREILWNR